MASPFSRTRNHQVVRILKLLVLLRRGVTQTKDLAAGLGVSKRTVRRDRAAIRYAGLDEEKRAGQGIEP